MPLLNYTTKVYAAKTVGEIVALLVKHGATAFQQEYESARIKALYWQHDTPSGRLPFKMPVNVEAVHKRLQAEHPGSSILTTREHAERVAWRILKDWVEVQVALVETGMVAFEEVFLPYAVLKGGETLYHHMLEGGFKTLVALTDGREKEAL